MTTTYRDAAVKLWGEAGSVAHDIYAELRPHYAELRLDYETSTLPEQVPIVIGHLPYGGLACTAVLHGDGIREPRIVLDPGLFASGRRMVADRIAHLMLHAAVHIEGDAAHKNKYWYDGVRELSPAILGHPLAVTWGADRKSYREANPAYVPGGTEPRTLVRKARVLDAVQHRDVAAWPQAFRPAGFYDRDPPVPCSF